MTLQPILKEEQQQLAAERKTQLEAINITRDEEAKTSNDRQLQLVQLQEQKKQVNGQLAEIKTQLEQANQGKAEQQKAVTDLQSEINECLSNKEKIEAELNQEIREAKQSLRLSIKIQTMRKKDLVD